jgi:biopolymer transport protein TolR
MRTNRRPQQTLMNQINVVPYIDVMLVLLVIFMVTAPMMNPGQVDLPNVNQSNPPAAAVPPLVVTIKKDSSLTLRDMRAGELEFTVSLATLLHEVKAKQAAQADQSVVIAADKSVRYEEVMNVMAVLKAGNVKKVGLLTQSAAK